MTEKENKLKSHLKKVVLVALNARYSHTSLSMRCLREYSRTSDQPDCTVQLAEWTINDQPLSLLHRLDDLQADCYAFSCYIWNIEMVRNLSGWLKQINPQIVVVWGGPEVSWQTDRLMASASFPDLIISGEGEQPFVSLLRQIVQTVPDWTVVPALTWRSGDGRIMHNNLPAYLPGDRWPFPYTAEELVSLKNRILYYESSRGCPYSCTYCLSAIDRTVRFKPLAAVWPELDKLIAADVQQVKFVDRTFNCQPARAVAIWQYLISQYRQQPFRTNFHFEIMADVLDDEAIATLKQAPPGLFQLEIGVQSTQPAVLQAINRVRRSELLEQRVRELRQIHSIHLHLDLIAGLPGDTLTGFRRSFDDVIRLRPHLLQAGFLKILPGSPMKEQATRLGFAWQDTPPYEVLRSDGLSFADLGLLKRVENQLDHYYNSGQYACTMQALLTTAASPFDLFCQLSDLYKTGGWEERNPGLEDRWQLLLTLAAVITDSAVPPEEDAAMRLGTNEWQTTTASVSNPVTGTPGTDFYRSAGKTGENQAWFEYIRSCLKLDYIRLGQRDRPPWQQALETSQDPDRQKILEQGRKLMKKHYPEYRRYRLEEFTGTVYAGTMADSRPGYGQGQPSGCLAVADDRVPCVAAFGWIDGQAVLLWQLPIKDHAIGPFKV